MTRRPHTGIATAAVVLMLAGPPPALLAGSPAGPGIQPPPPEVFPPPSEAELAALTHPSLRLELLRMVAEDQHARLTGS